MVEDVINYNIGLGCYIFEGQNKIAVLGETDSPEELMSILRERYGLGLETHIIDKWNKGQKVQRKRGLPFWL